MSNRPYYIAGNWKMHKTRPEAAELAKTLVAQLKDGKHKYLVAPSFTLLETVGPIVKGTNI
jgi:triosephosphate isomerase